MYIAYRPKLFKLRAYRRFMSRDEFFLSLNNNKVVDAP